MLRTELRYSLWTVPPLLVAMLGPLLPELLDALAFGFLDLSKAHELLRGSSLRYGLPCAVAVGFFCGGRERRRGTGDILATMPVSPLRRALTAAAPSVFWPTVCYTVTAATAFVIAWFPYPGGAGLFAGLVLADHAAVGAFGLFGFVAGRVVPWTLGAPVLALAVGVVLGEFLDDAAWARALNPAYAWMPDWYAPVWWYGSAAVLWTTALAAATVLLLAARRRWTALLPLSVAVAAALLLALNPGALWRVDREETALVCREGLPEVCLTRLHAGRLPQMSAALDEMHGRLRGLGAGPVRLVEVPHDREGRPLARPGPGELALAQVPSSTDQFLTAVARLTAGAGCERVPGAVVGAVSRWLLPAGDRSPYSAPGADAVLAKIKGLPPDDRVAWLRSHFTAARACEPGYPHRAP